MKTSNYFIKIGLFFISFIYTSVIIAQDFTNLYVENDLRIGNQIRIDGNNNNNFLIDANSTEFNIGKSNGSQNNTNFNIWAYSATESRNLVKAVFSPTLIGFINRESNYNFTVSDSGVWSLNKFRTNSSLDIMNSIGSGSNGYFNIVANNNYFFIDSKPQRAASTGIKFKTALNSTQTKERLIIDSNGFTFKNNSENEVFTIPENGGLSSLYSDLKTRGLFSEDLYLIKDANSGTNASGEGTYNYDRKFLGFIPGSTYIPGYNGMIAYGGDEQHNDAGLIFAKLSEPDANPNEQNSPLFLSKQAKVGIGTFTPTEKLDVNGKVRIRTLPEGTASDELVTTDANGNLRKVPVSTIGGGGTADGDAWGVTGENVAEAIGRTGAVGIGHLTLSDQLNLKSVLDIHGARRTRTHPSNVPGMYVTGNFAPAKGIEFRHSNGTQGIGFGYNTIYATGNARNQGLNLKAKGNGKVSVLSPFQNTAGGKFVVQNGQNGGSGRGIYMWGPNTTHWGIYMGQAGNKRSLAGRTAVSGANFSSHAIRFRTYNHPASGFIFENSSEKLLASINSRSGDAYFAGKMGIGVKLPTKKLDVNGEARIRILPVGTATDEVVTTDANGNLRKVPVSTIGSGDVTLIEENNFIDITDGDGGLVLSHAHVSSPAAAAKNFSIGSQAAATDEAEAEVLESKIKLVEGSIFLTASDRGASEGASLHINNTGDFQFKLGTNISPGFGYMFKGNDDLAFVHFRGDNKRVGIGDIPGTAYGDLRSTLDVRGARRTNTHPSNVPGMYVTGNFEKDKGIEFRHSNGTQGIGFGFNTIYATGSNPSQDLNLKARGDGHVSLTAGGSGLVSLTTGQDGSGASMIVKTQGDFEFRLGTNIYSSYGYSFRASDNKRVALLRDDRKFGLGFMPDTEIVDLKSILDVYGANRTGTHPNNVPGMYVTGNFASAKGIEFRHSNAAQGIGFGYNTIYAAGNNTNQDLNLKAKGNGKVSVLSPFQNTGGGKFVVQNRQNGGQGRGIHMWSATDTNWGIYMGQSGNTRSLAGGTAVSGANFSSHAIRFRTYNHPTTGFIFENSSEELLVSINGRSGDAYFDGKLEVNDQVASKEGYSIIGTDALTIGRDAGHQVDFNGKSHVFIGHDAGSKTGFDNIAVIDYDDDANTNPITGTQYLDNHSVFVLNNSNDLTKPLLFGNFAKDGVSNSMAQLAINTHHVVDSVALTVSGAVHIGPKNIDPTVFPSKEGYQDALLWVEKGIVTEDVTYAFTSSWKDWPDYVFEEDYDLMTLSELDKYIRKNKHLPNISTTEEVKENGLKSKGMIINLLKKIEELTLYTLNQEKKIENQQQLNQALLKRLIAIEEQLKN